MRKKKFNYVVLLPLLVVVFACISLIEKNNKKAGEAIEGYPFLEKSGIIFVEKTDAAALLGQSDVYTKGLSVFDIQAKTQNIASTKEADYLKNASSQAQNWTDEEIDKMKLIIDSVALKIKALNLNLNLPKQIKLVKTSMAEEGGAGGYTRSNYIVLESSVGQDIFAHEMFHIYSRANSDKRDELYKTIHFQKCNSIKVPAALQAMRITNPDAPTLEHFLKVDIDGKQQDVVFITYADKAYEGGSFFHYLKRDLLLIEDANDKKSVVLADGAAILKKYSESSNVYDFIGKNTGYNIHPEEVLAEHFSALVRGEEVKEPKYLEAMKLVLQK